MHNSPWIPIADLMSGFVVVVLLLFVSAAVIPKAQTEAQRTEVFEKFERELPEVARGFVRVDVEGRRLELSDVTFQIGSACLEKEEAGAQKAISVLRDMVLYEMDREPKVSVFVEGHADAREVDALVETCGGSFSDNTQLSVLRAGSVRDAILADNPDDYRRVPVVGWGALRLKNQSDPFAKENRRVEIRFVYE